MMGKQDIEMQENKTKLPCRKMNSKCIKDINIRPKTLKPLEESIGEKLHDIGFGNNFLDMTQKAQATKAKMELHQTSNLLPIKGSKVSIKEIYQKGENICKPYRDKYL